MPTMTGTEFIRTMFYSEMTFDDPVPMTPDEAAQTIAAWREEGIIDDIMMPPTVTPLLLSRVWNILCAQHCNA